MKHFTFAEFNASQADAIIHNNIRQLCDHLLDPLRDALGRPFIITSGYRDAARNRAAGGSATSDHLNGLAADFHVAGLSPETMHRQIRHHLNRLHLPFDQLILYPTFIHLSYRPKSNRYSVIIK